MSWVCVTVIKQRGLVERAKSENQTSRSWLLLHVRQRIDPGLARSSPPASLLLHVRQRVAAVAVRGERHGEAAAVRVGKRYVEELLGLPERPVRQVLRVRGVRVLPHGEPVGVQLPAGVHAALAESVEPPRLQRRVRQDRQPELWRRKRRVLGRETDEAAGRHERDGARRLDPGPVQAGVPQRLQLPGVRRSERQWGSQPRLRHLGRRPAGHAAVPHHGHGPAGCLHTARTIPDSRPQRRRFSRLSLQFLLTFR
jgi:hypothetical protein